MSDRCGLCSRPEFSLPSACRPMFPRSGGRRNRPPEKTKSDTRHMTIGAIFPFLTLSGALAFFVPGVRFKGIVSAALIAAGAVVATVAGVTAIVLPDAETGSGGWLPGLDALGGVFAIAVAICGVACAVYAVGYLPEHAHGKGHIQTGIHFTALVALFYSMFGVIGATERYGFLFWWELMTLSSFLLVLFDAQRKEVLHAAVGYLVLMHIGFFMLLGGFVAPGGGEAFFAGDGTMTAAAFLLFLAGFGMKAGLFPLHMWLPVAHPAAPSHVSALMSGVMIKMGIYGIVRAALALEPEALMSMGLLVFAAGAVTAVFGIARAAVQTDLKRLLAYSSVENIGIICLGIGLGMQGRALNSDFIAYAGFGAALLHVLGHANYKTMLFLGAGSVVAATGQRDMNRLGGLLQRMPITGILFLAAACAICTVPGLVGFTSEFVLFDGLFGSITRGESVVVAVAGIAALALVGGLTLMTFTKACGMAFLGHPRSRAARDAREVNGTMLLAQALPAAGIAAGTILYPYLVLENADALFGARYYAEPVIGTMATVEWVMLGVVFLTGGLLYLKIWLNRRAGVAVRQGPTWGCAFTAPSSRMQYTASSYNREIQTMWGDREAGKHPERLLAEEEIFPRPHTFSIEEQDTTARAVTHGFFLILRRWTARMALFQTGKTNHYVLHALVVLIAILLLSLCGWF